MTPEDRDGSLQHREGDLPQPSSQGPRAKQLLQVKLPGSSPQRLVWGLQSSSSVFFPPRHYLSALQHSAVGSGRAKGQASRGALGDQGVLEMPMSEP